MIDGTSCAVETLLRAQLADPNCTWSLGGYGAGATFARIPGEPAHELDQDGFGLVTGRGAIVLAPPPGLRPFAYETGFADGWSHAVALCLPAAICAMGRRNVLTELGPDRAAARPQDRNAILFDLGLGFDAVDACVRTTDPVVIDRLRAGLGRSNLASDHPVSPALVEPTCHWVFVTRVGRIEVYGSGAAAGTPGPAPRSHILPKLLRLRRTHAATAPIPGVLMPCGGFEPAHPLKDGAGRSIPFDTARHAAFGALLDAWGDPALAALRRAVLAGRDPDPRQSEGRFARSAIRAARAQVRVKDRNR